MNRELPHIQPKKVIGALIFVLLGIVPLFFAPSEMNAFIVLLFLMMFAISWDFLSGYTGQLNLGHTLFVGVGAYTTTILTVQHGLHPFASIIIATLVAVLFGLMIGIPALRVTGYYLAVLTLITPFLFKQITIIHADEFVLDIFGLSIPIAPDGLGGAFGLPFEPAPIVGTTSRAVISLSDFSTVVIAEYYLAYALLLFIFGLSYGITSLHIGSVFTAIRENPETVASVGINVSKFKLFGFVMSGGMAGLAGAVLVHTSAGFPQPMQVLSFQLSLNVIIVSVIGGLGTIIGAVVGTLAFAVIGFVIESIGGSVPIPFAGFTLGDTSPLPVFIVSIAVLYFAPEGIVPKVIDYGERLYGQYGERIDNAIDFSRRLFRHRL